MFDTIAMVILTVKDMKESVFFYEKVLGLPLKFQSPEWSEFKTKGARLGLHAETDTLKVSASQKLGISFGFSSRYNLIASFILLIISLIYKLIVKIFRYFLDSIKQKSKRPPDYIG